MQLLWYSNLQNSGKLSKKEKRKGSTGFILSCKADLKKIVYHSLRCRIESKWTDLRSNPDQFLALASMSLALFDVLFQSLQSHLMRNDTTMRKIKVHKTTGIV